jgi:hypothetical protein
VRSPQSAPHGAFAPCARCSSNAASRGGPEPGACRARQPNLKSCQSALREERASQARRSVPRLPARKTPAARRDRDAATYPNVASSETSLKGATLTCLGSATRTSALVLARRAAVSRLLDRPLPPRPRRVYARAGAYNGSRGRGAPRSPPSRQRRWAGGSRWSQAAIIVSAWVRVHRRSDA